MAQWKPGESGNPKGRPKKGFALNEAIEKAGRIRKEGKDGKRKASYRLLAEQIWEGALAGDVQLIKYLCDRVGGKPVEKVEVTGKDGEPIGVVFLPQRQTPEEWIENEEGDQTSVGSAAETENST